MTLSHKALGIAQEVFSLGCVLVLTLAIVGAACSLAVAGEATPSAVTGHQGSGGFSASPVHSPYAAHPGAAATGLLPEEVDGLVNGKGMALALAAEVNGYPGPRHVLDAADAGQLVLQPEQRAAVERLNAQMLAGAKAKGQEILEAEAHLAQRFRHGHIDEASLRETLNRIGQLRIELRFIHLRTHLTTRALLTPDQIARYNAARGYDGAGGGPHPHTR
jgi:Spy/CpxP family protein refolding chaperone